MSELWRLPAATLAGGPPPRALGARGRARRPGPARRREPGHQRRGGPPARTTLAQADAVDAAIARGDDPGVLAGVPVTVKVNTDQAGFATTNAWWHSATRSLRPTTPW